VSGDQLLKNLGVVDSDTVCRDWANAYYTFLFGGVQIQGVCREVAVESTLETIALDDGGLDADTVCSQHFSRCVGSNLLAAPQFYCPIPIPSSMPQNCDATVEDLSACLNELGALDPIDACVRAPGCDGGISADAAVRMDAADGGIDAVPPPSATPACERLHRICPALTEWSSFPC
jgi:hypothetical protein